MNGVHDMGGLQGFGPVAPEADEPLFHAAWERRALGLTLAMGATGQWNIDQSRAARESLPPAQYLASSYYQIWLAGARTPDAGARPRGCGRVAHRPGPPAGGAGGPRAARGRRRRRRWPVARRPSARPAAPAAFAVGDRVRARNRAPSRPHAAAALRARPCRRASSRPTASTCSPTPTPPDPGAAPWTEAPQWLYTVEFDGAELWGPDAEPGTRVSVEAWEPMLEPA